MFYAVFSFGTPRMFLVNLSIRRENKSSSILELPVVILESIEPPSTASWFASYLFPKTEIPKNLTYYGYREKKLKGKI